ncbi:MAG: quinolinate synthase NadA [Ignavibacteriae bacterium]|nr:quinolinate synthase NadA [Ignavibacteriota bacterium]
MDTREIIFEINKLRKEKNAVILAHNYQIGEIQDLADFVGDSLGLSQMAAKTEADLIVFCGVHFMAETASILAPQKKVIIPDLDAGCSLADSITAEELIKWKEENPGAIVVSYVNTTAEVKAETDYCCTSSNAVKVVNAIPVDKQILFLPDQYLGNYVKYITNRNMKIWNGACHVHEKIGELDFESAENKFPNAEFLIHPECGCSTSCMLKASQNPNLKLNIYSTEGMLRRVNESDSDEFVIATEVGILHRMKKNNPTKIFHPASEASICEYMKLNTFENLYQSLLVEKHEVKVQKEIADRARLSIQRMIEIF